MNYADEMGFKWHDIHTKYHKIGPRAQKLLGGIHRHIHKDLS